MRNRRKRVRFLAGTFDGLAPCIVARFEEPRKRPKGWEFHLGLALHHDEFARFAVYYAFFLGFCEAFLERYPELLIEVPNPVLE